MGLALKMDKRYTYTDYLSWPEDERWEIIDGAAYNMSPAPKTKHQRIVSQLDRKLGNKIEEKGCGLFIAPTDVVFDEFNVVQPDVFVVCDKNKITVNNIQGAPDMIIEVISPSTELKDKREKKNLYEKFGVNEYIIVHPDSEYVERYQLVENKYAGPDIYNWDEALKLQTFDIELNLSDIFEKKVEQKGPHESA